MTEFRRPEPSPIPAGGLSAVVHAGRRRRARLGASTGAAAAGLAVVAMLAGGTAGSQSLRPVSETPAPESPGPSAEPAESASPGTGPGGSPSPGAPASGEPGGGGAPGDPASPAPTGDPAETADPPEPGAPEPTAAPGDQPAGPVYAHHNVMRTGTGLTGPSFTTAGDDTDIWIAGGSVVEKRTSGGGRPPKTYDLRLSLCAPTVEPRTKAHELDYDTTQEADFAVVDERGAVVWRWSVGQSFAADPHTRAARHGECLWWATEWDGVADDGRLVDPGTYEVRMYSTARGWGDEPVTEQDVHIT